MGVKTKVKRLLSEWHKEEKSEVHMNWDSNGINYSEKANDLKKKKTS